MSAQRSDIKIYNDFSRQIVLSIYHRVVNGICEDTLK